MTPTHRQVDLLRTVACRHVPNVIDDLIRICEVSSPTGAEQRRAQLLRTMLVGYGYVAEIDDVGNVYTRRGSGRGQALMLAAHTDTVFPAGTDTSVHSVADRLLGAGVGDNSLGVAAAMCLLRMLDDLGVNAETDVIIALTVGEEGLGNLRGIRAAIDRYRTDVGGVIAVEGHNLGRVTHVGVGSVRWKVAVSGPGGHSWGAFGQPSAIHGLSRIVGRIAEIDVSGGPKTTYNVGRIEGGVSINTIAPSAEALIDMRSIDAAALQRLVDRVGTIASRAAGEGLETRVHVLGERPAGICPRTHPLVGAAGDALRAIGIEPIFDASSTDANVPISLGIPAICVGITRGGRGHTVDEYIETTPISDGLTQLASLTLRACELLASNWQ